jgi:hypothetical protein
MPDMWYTIKLEKSEDLTLTIIMIDTNILIGLGDIINLPNSDTIDYKALQEEWLENELKKCDTTYCLVAQASKTILRVFRISVLNLSFEPIIFAE